MASPELEQLAGRRAPDPEAGVLTGDVGDADRAVTRRVLDDPGEIVASERGARHDPEPLVTEARDGEVALDPAPDIQHGRVDDRADRLVDVVRAHPSQEGQGSRPGYLQLGE